MRNILFLIISVFFIAGCSSGIKRLELEPYAKLSSPSISINAPSNFPKDRWITYGDSLYDSSNVIQLFRHLPNMMSEDVKITVGSPENLKNSTEKFFIKDFNYEKWAQEVLNRPDIVTNMKERGVSYSKKYVDYIGGLKCGTDVESSNLALGVGSKRYYSVCGYYDTVGAKKRIDIFYNYTYTHSGTKYDGDRGSGSVSPEAMQRQFKQDMKAIFDSLVIHDMDRERMSKEGLLHDKKYDLESEFR
jgi:hypothetical protein